MAVYRRIMTSVVCLAMLGGNTFAQTVQIQLSKNLNLRTEKDSELLPETVIPAGSIVEISLDAFHHAQDMKYWTEGGDKTLQFVKGIKIVKAPGFSETDLKDINSWNKDEGLYMSKKYLGMSTIVSVAGDSQTVKLNHASTVYRNDAPEKAPGESAKKPAKHQQKVDTTTAGAIVDQVEQSNQAVKETGTAQGTCVSCNRDFMQKWIRAGVPPKALSEALDEQQKNPKGMIHNKRYITIVDFTQPSSAKRMFILDTVTGDVQKMRTSNGKNSETSLGHAGRFSNQGSSLETPAGFHVTGYRDSSGRVRTDQGIHHSPAHGDSLLLVGLENQNSNSAERNILIHGAWYARDSFVEQHGYAGRSHGCLAIDDSKLKTVLHELEGGSLVYNYTGK